MTMSRRRFITVTASCILAPVIGRQLLSPTMAEPVTWQGFALGAEASISLLSKELGRAKRAIAEAVAEVRMIERQFSIYDPESAISRLNLTGKLQMEPVFCELVACAAEANRMTSGLFDPTVQSVFARQADGSKPGLIDWSRVNVAGNSIELAGSDMAITFNGIAQGFASDRVAGILKAHGFTDCAVNIGEWCVGDRPAKLSVENKAGNRLHRFSVANAAVATSSANGYLLRDGTSHIIDPRNAGQAPFWRTVSVKAKSATVADSLSTALMLSTDTRFAARLKRDGHLLAVVFEDRAGNVVLV